MDIVQSDLTTRPGDVAFWNRLRAGLIARENAKSDAVTRDMIHAGNVVSKYKHLEQGWDDPDRVAMKDMEGIEELKGLFPNDKYHLFIEDVVDDVTKYEEGLREWYIDPPEETVKKMLYMNFDDFYDYGPECREAIILASRLLFLRENLDMGTRMFRKVQVDMGRLFEEFNRKAELLDDVYIDPVTLQWSRNRKKYTAEELQLEYEEGKEKMNREVEAEKAKFRRVYESEGEKVPPDSRRLPSNATMPDMIEGSKWVNFGRELKLWAQDRPSVTKRRRIS